jgi:hypothetical protein
MKQALRLVTSADEAIKLIETGYVVYFGRNPIVMVGIYKRILFYAMMCDELELFDVQAITLDMVRALYAVAIDHSQPIYALPEEYLKREKVI